MPERMSTRGRIEYQFKVCGALTIVFMEIELRIGSGDERLNLIAQVIAEADGMSTSLLFPLPLTNLFALLQPAIWSTRTTVSDPRFTPYFVMERHSSSSPSTAAPAHPCSRGASPSSGTVLPLLGLASHRMKALPDAITSTPSVPSAKAFMPCSSTVTWKASKHTTTAYYGKQQSKAGSVRVPLPGLQLWASPNKRFRRPPEQPLWPLKAISMVQMQVLRTLAKYCIKGIHA